MAEDSAIGGPGDDTLNGNNGDDLLVGDEGNDTFLPTRRKIIWMILSLIAELSFSVTAGTAATPSELPNSDLPGVPSGLEVTDVTTTSVALVWNASSGADDYQIERRASEGTWSSVENPGSSIIFIDSSVEEGAEYEYRVAASNSTGLSDYGPGAFATTLLSVPDSYFGEYLSATNTIRIT